MRQLVKEYNVPFIILFNFFIFRSSAFPNIQCLDLLIFRLAQLCDLSLQCLSKLQIPCNFIFTRISNIVTVETASHTKCVHATHERDGCTIAVQKRERERERERTREYMRRRERERERERMRGKATNETNYV